MSRSQKIAAWFGLGLAVVVGIAFLFYLIFIFEVQVFGRTLSRPIRLDGQVLVHRNELPEVPALRDQLEQVLAPRLVVVSVDGVRFTTTTEELALSVPAEDLAQAARIDFEGRGAVEQFASWLQSWWQWVYVRDYVEMDEGALYGLVTYWEEEIGLSRPFPGGLTLTSGDVVIDPAQAGSYIDTQFLVMDIQQQLEDTDPGAPLEVATSVRSADAARMQASLEELARDLEYLIENTFTLALSSGGTELVLPGEEIASWLDVSWDPVGRSHEVGIDVAAMYDRLDLSDAEARNAYFDWDSSDGSVAMVPSQPGLRIDEQTTMANLRRSLREYDQRIVVEATPTADPEVTSADLEALGVEHVLAAFTTFHPCCQERVQNIHIMADRVDGTVVMPGETFSLNEHIGERTEAAGFLAAPAIQEGELVDEVGGGVSQFATTLYNTVFWGGLEDVTHAPHSRYFSRYPEGIEATVSWPVPNLIFRNDYDTPIVIETAYTDTSITVAILGDNNGRSISGEQRYGRTNTSVINSGDGDARRVVAWTSDRYNQQDPGTDYIGDASLPRKRLVLEETGYAGWDLTVTRDIYVDEQVYADDTWIVRYRPVPNRVRIHPCDIPEGVAPIEGDSACVE